MKALIECFYRSIRENAPVPIPYREILLTSSIMDSIFDQLRHRGPEQLAASRAKADIVDRTTSELQYLSHKALCYDNVVGLVG